MTQPHPFDYHYVARPIFTALPLVWLWRLFLLGMLLRRIAALRLSLRRRGITDSRSCVRSGGAGVPPRCAARTR